MTRFDPKRRSPDLSPIRSKLLVHHEGVNEAEYRMPETEWEAADLRKPVRLPRPDRALVGADDEIELHGTEASFFGSAQRMLEHQTGDTLALRLRRCHVPAICDVIAASSVVCT